MRRPEPRRRPAKACAIATALVGILGSTVPAGAALFGLLGDKCVPKEGSALEALRERGESRFNPAMTVDHGRALQLLKPRWHGLLPSKELDLYLNAILDRLAKVVDPSGLPARVYTTTSTDFQASVSPDGAIFLPYGMISQAESEDELAFVLAHELGHVLARHHASDWFIKTQYYAVVSGAMLDNLANGLAHADGALGRAGLEGAGEIDDVLWKVKLAYDVSTTVVQPAWNAAQDRCADAIGYDILKAAGYATDTINDFFGRVITLETIQTENAKTALLDSTTADLGAGGLWGGFTNFFRRHSAELLEMVKSRPVATERQKKLAEYTARYPPVEVDIRDLAWKDPKRKELKALFANYAKVTGALDALTARTANAKVAEKLAKDILPTLKPPTSGHALPLFALAMARQKQGKDEDYVQNLERATHAVEGSWAAYSGYVAMQMEQGDFAKAETAIASAISRFGDSPVLLPRRIELAFRSGKKGEIFGLRTRCLQFEIKDLSERCERAAATGDQSPADAAAAR